MHWQAEPFWLFWQREMTLQRALKAEASVERLSWQQEKLKNRLHKHVHKLWRRGWLSVP